MWDEQEIKSSLEICCFVLERNDDTQGEGRKEEKVKIQASKYRFNKQMHSLLIVYFFLFKYSKMLLFLKIILLLFCFLCSTIQKTFGMTEMIQVIRFLLTSNSSCFGLYPSLTLPDPLNTTRNSPWAKNQKYHQCGTISKQKFLF